MSTWAWTSLSGSEPSDLDRRRAVVIGVAVGEPQPVVHSACGVVVAFDLKVSVTSTAFARMHQHVLTQLPRTAAPASRRRREHVVQPHQIGLDRVLAASQYFAM